MIRLTVLVIFLGRPSVKLNTRKSYRSTTARNIFSSELTIPNILYPMTRYQSDSLYVQFPFLFSKRKSIPDLFARLFTIGNIISYCFSVEFHFYYFARFIPPSPILFFTWHSKCFFSHGLWQRLSPETLVVAIILLTCMYLRLDAREE